MTSQYGRCTSKTRDTNQSAGPHILFSALLLKLCELIFVSLLTLLARVVEVFRSYLERFKTVLASMMIQIPCIASTSRCSLRYITDSSIIIPTCSI